jgi:O-antigen ligase
LGVLWASLADMAMCLAAILVLLPLILAPHLLFYWDVTPKILVLLAGTVVAAPLMWRVPRAQSPALRVFGIALAAEALSLAVSTAFSADPALSLGGSAWRRFGLIAQMAMLPLVWIAAQHTAGHPERARQLLRVIALSGTVAAVYGILQYFGWDPLIDPRRYHIGETPLTIVRPPGTLGYVSYFATYLLSVIFAGAALASTEDSRAWKSLGAVAFVLATVALILTGTRAAMLGLVCGAAFFAFWLRPRIRARQIAAALVVAAALVGFYFSPAGQLLRSRARWFVEDASGGARPLLWRDTIRMAADRWAAGFGPETFSIWFPRYQSAELARAYPAYYQESPHNIFLDALAAQGAPGALILVATTLIGFYAVRKASDRKLAAALGAALVALVVSQLFTSFTLPTALFFYLTIALLAGQAFAPVPRPVNHRAARALAGAVVSLTLVAFAVPLFFADAALARVDRLIQAGNLREAATVYRRVLRWEPPGMRTDLWYSRAIAGAASHAASAPDAIMAWQQGLEAANRAARNAEERENAWLNLAVFYGRQNDFPDTEQSLRSAIACAPNWFRPHWLLAQVLRASGRMEEARVEASRAADLDAGRNPEVTRTFAEIRKSINISEK